MSESPAAEAGRFTVEIPVRFTRGVERAVLRRLVGAQRLSNEILAVYLARVARYHRDSDLRRLRAERAAARRAKPVPAEVVPRQYVFESAAERASAWRELQQRHGLHGKYEPDKAWVKDLTSAQRDVGAVGLAADLIHHEIVMRARERVLRWIHGETGKPRFASRRHPRTSIAGSSSAKNGGSLRVDVAKGTVSWAAAGVRKHVLVGDLIFDAEADPYLRRALRGEICQVRLLHRTLRGRRRWYVQLVVAGAPPLRPDRYLAPDRAGVVGVDLGTQHYAAVAIDAGGAVRQAWIEDLAPEAARREARRDRDVAEEENARKRDRYIRSLQRRASKRMRRNPANAHAIATRKKTLTRTRDGRAVGKVVEVEAGIRRRARIVKSRAVRADLATIAEVKRADAAARDTNHGTAANRILSAGALVALEQLSYVAWQRAHGRSTQRRGAGALVARIKRRAPLFGAAVIELPASLKLSQLCHACGGYTPQKAELRKPIALRTSSCGCGREDVQRDVYSSFLAAFAAGEMLVDTRAAQAAWAGSVSILESARRVYESGRLASLSGGAACASGAPGRLSMSTIARQTEVQRLRSAMPSEPRAIDAVEDPGGAAPLHDRSTPNRQHDAADSPPACGRAMRGRGHPLESRAENAGAIRPG